MESFILEPEDSKTRNDRIVSKIELRRIK